MPGHSSAYRFGHRFAAVGAFLGILWSTGVARAELSLGCGEAVLTGQVRAPAKQPTRLVLAEGTLSETVVELERSPEEGKLRLIARRTVSVRAKVTASPRKRVARARILEVLKILPGPDFADEPVKGLKAGECDSKP